ncbi:mitochondrial ubiquitin ligase activator of NFKB 1 [Chlorella sorokiniana]|uniref:RING-type E3 ubiquitin transferase n=1 Tax=Chlorella sorokiniana TaxID=3076 RepID=A0A2P6TU54_CHLSO|nr:mitochondrial ubiquitin ligase activator of NFKB 1 [Chlorella sorokiniana]|eukprot:PRW57591.1 mitochondrial ubiquitin ligase activator of NFKB 1 [Chlorella sorokiniana]
MAAVVTTGAVAGTLLGLGGLAFLGACGLRQVAANRRARARSLQRDLDEALHPDSIASLSAHARQLPRRVVLQGRVHTASPIVAALSGREAAVVQAVELLVTEKRQRTEDGGELRWVRRTSLLMEETRSTAWSLVDGSGAELPIELPQRGRKGLLEGVLENGGDRLMPNRESRWGRVAEELLGDRTVGVQKSEEILPLGTVLTAVGELRSMIASGRPDAFEDALRTPGGRMLVLCPSLLSRTPIHALVNDAESDAVEMEARAKLAQRAGYALLIGATLAGVACVFAACWGGSGGW